MTINLKNNLHWLLYSAGLLVYLVLLTQSTLALSIIWLIFILYIWLVVSIVLQQYFFKSFLYVCCASGILVAISIFFINGIEELAFPQGAVLFKIEGIAQAVVLFFVFSVPLLIYNSDKNSWFFTEALNQTQKDKATSVKPTQQSIAIDSEEWEEATIEELESGTYEPI